MDEPLSQEEYELLLKLGANNSDIETVLKRQLEQAARLRAQANTPNLDTRGALHVFNPLANVANAVQGRRADAMDANVDASRQQMSSNTAQQNQMLMQALLRRGMQQPQQQANPFVYPGSY